jgi:hypothetical protein
MHEDVTLILQIFIHQQIKVLKVWTGFTQCIYGYRHPVDGELVVLVTLAKMSRKPCEGWTHLGVP